MRLEFNMCACWVGAVWVGVRRHHQKIPQVDLKYRVHQSDPHAHRKSWGEGMTEESQVRNSTHECGKNTSTRRRIPPVISRKCVLVNHMPGGEMASAKSWESCVVFVNLCWSLTFAMKSSLKVCSSNTLVCSRSVPKTHFIKNSQSNLTHNHVHVFVFVPLLSVAPFSL